MRYKLEELADEQYLLVVDPDFPISPQSLQRIADQEEIDKAAIWYIRYTGFESAMVWNELKEVKIFQE